MATSPISQLNGGVQITVVANGDLLAATDASDPTEDPDGTTKPISRKTLITLATATKTTDYTTTDDDDILFLNSATDKTLSLIAGASRGAGRPYYLKNINAGVWTIDPNAAETIEGAATLNLAERDRAQIVWTGSAWEIF